MIFANAGRDELRRRYVEAWQRSARACRWSRSTRRSPT